MSYCRFSSMNWMCDVYVYEDCSGGWTTHVASNRAIFPPVPEITWPRPFGVLEIDKATMRIIYKNKFYEILNNIRLYLWSKSRRINMFCIRLIPKKKIGLQYDGQTFNDPTPLECAERLEMLKRIGYRVPQYAIDNLREENDSE